MPNFFYSEAMTEAKVDQWAKLKTLATWLQL